MLWYFLLFQNTYQLLLNSAGISVYRVNIKSYLALYWYLLKEGQAQVHLWNCDMFRIRIFWVEPQEEEEKLEYSIFSFQAKASNKVDHFFVDFSCVDSPIDQRQGLKERKYDIFNDNSFIVAVICFGECHHQNFINIFETSAVDRLLQEILFFKDHLSYIFSDHLDVLFYTCKLISIFEEGSFLFLFASLVVLIPTDIQ